MPYLREHQEYDHYLNAQSMAKIKHILTLVIDLVDLSALEGLLQGMIDGDDTNDQHEKAFAERVLSSLKYSTRITGDPDSIDLPD